MNIDLIRYIENIATVIYLIATAIKFVKLLMKFKKKHKKNRKIRSGKSI